MSEIVAYRYRYKDALTWVHSTTEPARHPNLIVEPLCVAKKPLNEAENAHLRAAMNEACDLLAERVHGNAARSPGHNARVVLEWALKPHEKEVSYEIGPLGCSSGCRYGADNGMPEHRCAGECMYAREHRGGRS